MQLDGDIASTRINFGKRIRHLREQRGLSQYKFSDMAGINRSYLIDVEKGRRNVSIDAIIKLSYGLGMPLSGLFEGVDVIEYTVEFAGDPHPKHKGATADEAR